MIDRTVYLSFHRGCSTYFALSLFHALRARDFDVFIDAGEYDLRDPIDLAEIEARVHFLVILAPCLIENLQNPDDPMWRELNQAIHKRRKISLVFPAEKLILAPVAPRANNTRNHNVARPNT